MTGSELLQRLMGNIKTSLELRSTIPYLDILKELAEGGAGFSTSILNTSSNFGSFDHYLSEVLYLLHTADPKINLFITIPLPLTQVTEILTTHALLVAVLFQDDLDRPNLQGQFLYRLDLINAASV
jgi:hypothetical protein